MSSAATSPFLTVEDLAERWRTTPNAIRCRNYKGDLPPATHVSRRLLFRLEDVEAFEAERTDRRG